MTKKKNSVANENTMILPLLALDKHVVTPLIPQPTKIEDQEQIDFLEKYLGPQHQVFVATSTENPSNSSEHQILETGIIGIVDRVLKMPGAPTLAFIRPISKAKFINEVFHPDYPMAKVKSLPEIHEPKRLSAESKALLERVDELFQVTMQYVGEPEKSTAEKLVADNSESLVWKLYSIAHVAPIQWHDKYLILQCGAFKSLLTTLALVLDETEQKISLQALIHEKTHHELSLQQKETFLRQHLKNVKEELGEGEDNDITALTAKAETKLWSQETKKHFDKEIKKLDRLNINNPEYSVQYAYLEALLDLPWNYYQQSDISIDKVQQVLDRDHFGLEKVKERILEYMAVAKLRNDLKAPILCLYGPPGVGKTSIGKSVAEAVGREYARISLGGVHDEAEIRGHRRTYIGAMPGRFLHALSKLKYGNPLILLDEIDKVGKDYKGDPSSALLEALDPEQNNTFHDNFIDHPYDLSKVLFIATANDLNTIPPPLRDRMEIIEMPAYKHEEKREIAKRHLVKQALQENGFDKDEISFSTEAIDAIIRRFTKEAGVRQLKMQISKLLRKLALQKVRGEQLPKEVTETMVSQLLDKTDSYHSRLGFQ